MYRIFIRDWWVPNPNWPDGREPQPGKKRYVGRAKTIDEAREKCAERNERLKGHKMGRMAEFERAGP